jgi:hypothetical protein
LLRAQSLALGFESADLGFNRAVALGGFVFEEDERPEGDVIAALDDLDRAAGVDDDGFATCRAAAAVLASGWAEFPAFDGGFLDDFAVAVSGWNINYFLAPLHYEIARVGSAA